MIPNSIVTGSVSGTTTNQYELRLTVPIQFVVLFQVVTGSATLDLHRGSGARLFTLNQSDPGEPLGAHSTPLITSSVNSVYHIRIHGQGQYRFEVYSSLPAPEHAAANIAIGDTVATEDLHAPNDVDVFHFTGAAGDELIGYLKAGALPGSGVLRLAVTRPGADNTVLGAVSSTGARPFEFDATARFVLPGAGEYTVTLSTANPQSGTQDFSGPYTFQIRRIDRNAEHGSGTFVAGPAVSSEALDYVGDIDRFSLTGAPGDEIILRLLATHGDTTAFRLEVPDVLTLDPGLNEVIPATLSRGTDSVLTDQTTFRFHLPASGLATVQVMAQNQPGTGAAVAKGAYVIRADRVNRAPEVASPILAIGDSVTTEGIEPAGDIDEYSVTVTTSDTVSIVLALDSASFAARSPMTRLTATHFPMAGALRRVTSPSPIGRRVVSSSGSFAIEPGQYMMRVLDPLFGILGATSYSGPYRLFIHRIRSAPETAPGVIAIGDTVTDAVFPLGDMDVYSFPGLKGDVIDLQIQGLGVITQAEFAYQLFAPNAFNALAGGFVGTSTARLSDARTGRITLPVTGTYRITVNGNNGGRVPEEHGPYRMALLRLSTSPEVHAATLAVGDIVSDEALDHPDDVDDFTLQGPPGTEVAVFIRTVGVLPNVLAEALVSTTMDTIRTAQGSGGTTGRFLIPASGEVLLRVSEPQKGTGPYRLEVFPINRAPEHTSPAYAIGTVAPDGTIDALGADVDEYQFTGTAGQKVVGYFQTPNGGSFPGLLLEILAPGTLDVLASIISVLPTANLQDNATATITLPVSGQYVIRVRGVSDRASTGVYRFSVQIVP